MEIYPAVIVHGLGDALAALARGEAEGTPVTLLSAAGAALYAGCGWWRALVETARARHPNVPCMDILDCADGSGQALAALRIGLPRLVLWPEAPGRAAVVAIAEAQGGFVLAKAPPADPVATNSPANRGVVPALRGAADEPAQYGNDPDGNDPDGNGDKPPAPG